MMNRIAKTIGLAVVLLSASAARAENGQPEPDDSWVPADIDWRDPVEVVVELQDNLFEPDDLVFDAGKAYRLVLRNVGGRPHDMVDPDFFHSIVVRRVTSVDGTVVTPHLHSLYIHAGSEMTLLFVPVKTVSSNFYCSLPGHRDDGMEGSVAIR